MKKFSTTDTDNESGIELLHFNGGVSYEELKGLRLEFETWCDVKQQNVKCQIYVYTDEERESHGHIIDFIVLDEDFN